MSGKERDEHQAACPRCDAEAEWSYLDAENNEIEVVCSECGRYVLTKEEFDKAMTERAEP
jgi:transcription elongation factor Elf1